MERSKTPQQITRTNRIDVLLTSLFGKLREQTRLLYQQEEEEENQAIIA
jgi:hypothetical protein